MYVVREIMHCKPGNVRGLVDKFKTVSGILERQGQKPMRILTDVSGDRYWTLIAETEVDTLDDFFDTQSEVMTGDEFQRAMQGYHDLVASGHREIYRIEA